jgi:hypothetical protein
VGGKVWLGRQRAERAPDTTGKGSRHRGEYYLTKRRTTIGGTLTSHS